MTDPLSKRILRVRHALGVMKTENVQEHDIHVHKGTYGVYVDFNQGRTPTELEHAAYALIASIASLKDHLKHWCDKTGTPFHGDALIDSNHSVALVHDLWNTDKHASLSKNPRSGIRPILRDIEQALVLTSGTEEGASIGFTVDMETGEPKIISSGGGSASYVIDAQIIDEHGVHAGWLQQVCTEAIAAWEAAIIASGANIPEA